MSNTFTIRLDKETRATLKRLAARHGLAEGPMIRSLIRGGEYKVSDRGSLILRAVELSSPCPVIVWREMEVWYGADGLVTTKGLDELVREVERREGAANPPEEES